MPQALENMSSPQQNEDAIRTTIGDFGRWQFKISLLMALLKFPIAWFTLSIVFLAPPTRFWCKAPELDAAAINYTDIKWLNLTGQSSTLKHEGLNTGHCQMRIPGDNSTSCMYGYGYNRSTFHSSIITEWNLVCGRQRLIDLSQITLMLGILTGNIFFGILADRKGRKTILMICIVFQSLFGIIAAWMPWYWSFVVFRFLLAVFNGGTTVTSFVMCMEVVGGKWRTIVPILYQIPFGFGNTIMAAVAFYIRDWRQFHFTLSSLSALYILYFWLVPESPRWLLAMGRREEAMKILLKAAADNGKSPEKVTVALTDLSNAEGACKNPPVTVSALFSTPALRKRSYLLCLNWIIAGVTFYAFSQYLGQVSQGLYFTVAVGGMIALPGTVFCVFIVTRCGRRWTIASAHLLTAVCFLAILFVPLGVFIHDWPRIGFAALGIVGMSISMPALYLFTGELFPTVLRNAGVGVSVMCSRIGSMIAPLIIALQDVAPFLPLLILAVAAVLEAILVLPLPETRGQRLPDTICDVDSGYTLEKIDKEKSHGGSYVSVCKEEEDELE